MTSDKKNTQLHNFTKSLPKIELHAHLNGSIRQQTLIELASQRNVILPPKMMLHDTTNATNNNVVDGNQVVTFWNTHPRNLQDCFEVFEYIPQCVNDLVALQRITEEVLVDAAEDGVVYMEVRTGPKCLLKRHHNHDDDGGDDGRSGEMATKREYVETIIEIMREFERKEQARYDRECREAQQQQPQQQQRKNVRLPLIPRLIISVDRGGTVEQADENINLAIEFFQQQQQQQQRQAKVGPDQSKYIVGVELGGNPTRNDFTIFKASFERARRAGLRVAIHIGEVPMKVNDDRYNEALDVINFRPDRLGHALTLSPSLIDLLEKNPIPIECCPTSNTMTLDFALHHEGSLIDGIQMHPHLKKWVERKYPISINTDDSGIFCTTLTKEYMLIAKVFDLDERRLSEIVLDSVEHAFDDDIKVRLREDIQSVIEELIVAETFLQLL